MSIETNCFRKTQVFLIVAYVFIIVTGFLYTYVILLYGISTATKIIDYVIYMISGTELGLESLMEDD